MISGTDSSSPIEEASPKKSKVGTSSYAMAGAISSGSITIPISSVSKDAVATVEHSMCSHYCPSIASPQDAIDVCEADEEAELLQAKLLKRDAKRMAESLEGIEKPQEAKERQWGLEREADAASLRAAK